LSYSQIKNEIFLKTFIDLDFLALGTID